MRARLRFDEFKTFIGGGALWRIDEAEYSKAGAWGYTLRLNRLLLKKIERVAADCAIDLMSALDHLAAALAKANGHQHIRNLYYPFGTTEDAYQAQLEKHKAALAGYESLLARAHGNFAAYVLHVDAAKELSNTSKHWSFLAPIPSARAIAWQVSGVGQKIENVPAEHFSTSDSFEFYRGPERLNLTPINIVIMLSLSGLNSTIKSPDMVLECALWYVEGVLSEVSTKAV